MKEIERDEESEPRIEDEARRLFKDVAEDLLAGPRE